MATATSTSKGPAIRSEFADDPDFLELLEMFYESLQERRVEMANAFQNGNFEQVKTLAHQLKGAGGGYGFPGLTPIASRLENACKNNDLTSMPEHISAVIDYIDRVII